MFHAPHVTELHQLANSHWHFPARPEPPVHSAFDRLVLEQHRANFDLWHREDEARDAHAADAVIAAVKRAIDELNQRRNDLAEQIDCALLQAAPPSKPDVPLHSETPGLMIDRLSILSLKIFHTAEEIEREDANEAHRRRNSERLAVLLEQRDDLSGCLATLWDEMLAGKRRFKLYRQLKMYNDPELNPVLYSYTARRRAAT